MIATIIISLVIAGLAARTIVKGIKNQKNGTCGSDCCGCSTEEICHKEN